MAYNELRDILKQWLSEMESEGEKEYYAWAQNGYLDGTR